MRNIVTGNYGAKTKISSGYNSVRNTYSEGDVWEEKGKQWTIKNGIRRTVNKLDSIRQVQKIPLCCPKCNNSLSHPAHKKMFKRWGMCLVCVTKWENKMKSDGTYEEWLSQFDKKNFNAFIKDASQEYEDWLKDRNSKHYISEAGDIEEWSGGESNEDMAKQFYQTMKAAIEKKNGTTY